MSATYITNLIIYTGTDFKQSFILEESHIDLIVGTLSKAIDLAVSDT